MPELGVNIDHVATVRQARLGAEPSVKRAALEAFSGGADAITVHLREDRRHIQEYDVWDVKKFVRLPLNLEMAVNEEIVKFALRVNPERVCLVPEKRKELTTEGGLDVCGSERKLKKAIPRLVKKNIEVSLFIAPSRKQIKKAAELGAQAIEIHTGNYANRKGEARKKELERIRSAAKYGLSLGLKVNAGHGLDYRNVKPIAKIKGMSELNIGHSIVARALSVGMKRAVREMKQLIR